MDEVEAVDLVRWVQALCPQQHIDRFTHEAWFEVLEDFDFADCKAAATACARLKPFVAPAEIIAEVQRVRGERLKSWFYEPDQGEDVEGYLARRRAQASAIASGESLPGIAVPGGRPALQLVPGVEERRVLPLEVAAVVGLLRHPARCVRCPSCGAREGFSCCSDRRVVPGGAHAERVALWAVGRVVCPECAAVPGVACRRGPGGSLRQAAHSVRVQVAEREAA